MCPAATTVRSLLAFPLLHFVGWFANGDGGIGGGRLSCVQQSNLQCDNNVIERGKSLCRAIAANGLFDGARIIQNLGQAQVN